MKVTLDIDDGDGKNLEIEFTETENHNFVRMELKDEYYYISIVDLYRATMPFMDYRHEERQEL